MISLLDDTDSEVRNTVWNQMMNEGQDFIEQLGEIDEHLFEPQEYENLLKVRNRLNVNNLKLRLADWKFGSRDILEGMALLARYDKPDLTVQEVSNHIEKLKLDAWLEMNYDLTAIEKVKILNHVFFNVHGFKGDDNTFLHSKNSLIHRVLEGKSGNPITLSVIYSIVAQRLGIPIFGVNVPQHFMLAYVDVEPEEMPVSNHRMFGDGSYGTKEVLFYIDPFNNGNLLNRQMLENFVRSLKLTPNDTFFHPCNNIDIMNRAFRNLLNAYAIEEKRDKVSDVQLFINELE